jgi:hypothetical protein
LGNLKPYAHPLQKPFELLLLGTDLTEIKEEAEVSLKCKELVKAKSKANAGHAEHLYSPIF